MGINWQVDSLKIEENSFSMIDIAVGTCMQVDRTRVRSKTGASLRSQARTQAKGCDHVYYYSLHILFLPDYILYKDSQFTIKRILHSKPDLRYMYMYVGFPYTCIGIKIKLGPYQFIIMPTIQMYL